MAGKKQAKKPEPKAARKKVEVRDLEAQKAGKVRGGANGVAARPGIRIRGN